MKKTLLIIALLTIILISGFAKNNQTDSIAYAKQTVQLKELNTKVDSLIKVTDKLSEEKNYFSAALSSQTTIFSVIIAIALAILGGYSVLSIEYKIKRYRKDIDQILKIQNHNIRTIEEVNKKHDESINNALAMTYTTVAKLFENEDKSLCFKFLISGALYHMYNKAYNILETQLKISLEIIKDPSYFQKTHNDVVNNYKTIDEDFLELINCEHKAVKEIALKIYSKYLEFKEQDPVVEASPKA